MKFNPIPESKKPFDDDPKFFITPKSEYSSTNFHSPTVKFVEMI